MASLMWPSVCRGPGLGRLPSVVRFVCLVVGLCLAVSSWAVTGARAAERRVALIIGNAEYRHVASLINPVNDATDLSEALTGFGFEVMLRTDVDKRTMDRTLADFARLADGADLAVMFYAGHGVQYGGINYLIPVDAELQDEISINYESIPLDDLIGAFSGVKGARILIVDACRDNPVKSSAGPDPLPRGLARINSPRGMLIASATQANEVAYDGKGRNSAFTSAILATLSWPGLEIHEFFRRVSLEVNSASGGVQTPELSSSLGEPTYLNRTERAEDVWARIRISKDAADYEQFIERFPDSMLADAARARLDNLALAQRLKSEEAAAAAKGPSARTEVKGTAKDGLAPGLAGTPSAKNGPPGGQSVAQPGGERQHDTALVLSNAPATRPDTAEPFSSDSLGGSDPDGRADNAVNAEGPEALTPDRLSAINLNLGNRRRRALDTSASPESAVDAPSPPAEIEVASVDLTVPGIAFDADLSSAAVRRLQKELARLGCRSEPPNGSLDRQTADEISAYMSAARFNGQRPATVTGLTAHMASERMNGCRPVADVPAEPPMDRRQMCDNLIDRMQTGILTDDDAETLRTSCG